MRKNESGKNRRILDIYTTLMQGKTISKSEMAEKYNVDLRSIQRDIADIRAFIQENAIDNIGKDIVYDRKDNTFHLKEEYSSHFTNDEVLAICKILLDCRAFRKDDMVRIIEKLLDCCVPQKNRKVVSALISNEVYHYVPPRHNSRFLSKMWAIGEAIKDNRILEISYKRLKDKKIKKRRIMPLAIMFSEYYFYLTAFIDEEETRKDFDVINDAFPTIYRIDRIKSLTVLPEKFSIPYASRFEEGEFRKRIQFMYGGKLRRIKFEYCGLDVDAVLDRLPTAKIVEEREKSYIITAEVFGDGIEMWIRSQGDNIKMIQR